MNENEFRIREETKYIFILLWIYTYDANYHLDLNWRILQFYSVLMKILRFSILLGVHRYSMIDDIGFIHWKFMNYAMLNLNLHIFIRNAHWRQWMNWIDDVAWEQFFQQLLLFVAFFNDLLLIVYDWNVWNDTIAGAATANIFDIMTSQFQIRWTESVLWYNSIYANLLLTQVNFLISKSQKHWMFKWIYEY